MEIVETAVFTRRITEFLNDEEYRELQAALSENPELGKVITGGGGLRKVRWARSGGGKRGGYRVIYYWAVREDMILMLFIYPKNEMESLTEAQMAALRKIVEAEYP